MNRGFLVAAVVVGILSTLLFLLGEPLAHAALAGALTLYVASRL